MFELAVLYGKGWYYPMYRYSGVQQWRYVQVDGQIVCFSNGTRAQQYVEGVRAEMMAQGWICRVLAVR
jgi:hypothetical protein